METILLIVWPKCTLAASHAALVSHGEYADHGTNRVTDRRTDARPLHCAFRYGRGQGNKLRYVDNYAIQKATTDVASAVQNPTLTLLHAGCV